MLLFFIERHPLQRVSLIIFCKTQSFSLNTLFKHKKDSYSQTYKAVNGGKATAQSLMEADKSSWKFKRQHCVYKTYIHELIVIQVKVTIGTLSYELMRIQVPYAPMDMF